MLSVSGGALAGAVVAHRPVAAQVNLVETSPLDGHPAAQKSLASALVRHGRRAASPNPAVSGSWTPPMPFRPPGGRGPYVAIHMSLLPNGMVLSWPHDYNYFLKERHAAPYTPDIMLWDPATKPVPRPCRYSTTNIFCSGSTFLPNGDLIILGGHGPSAIPTAVFKRTTGTIMRRSLITRRTPGRAGPNMAEGRYYGSAITLGNGQVIAIAGYNEYGGNDPLIELYTPGQGWRTLSGEHPDTSRTGIPISTSSATAWSSGPIPGSDTFFINPIGAGQIWQGPSLNYRRRY